MKNDCFSLHRDGFEYMAYLNNCSISEMPHRPTTQRFPGLVMARPEGWGPAGSGLQAGSHQEQGTRAAPGTGHLPEDGARPWSGPAVGLCVGPAGQGPWPSRAGLRGAGGRPSCGL